MLAQDCIKYTLGDSMYMRVNEITQNLRDAGFHIISVPTLEKEEDERERHVITAKGTLDHKSLKFSYSFYHVPEQKEVDYVVKNYLTELGKQLGILRAS